MDLSRLVPGWCSLIHNILYSFHAKPRQRNCLCMSEPIKHEKGSFVFTIFVEWKVVPFGIARSFSWINTLDTAEYLIGFLLYDWLYSLWHGIVKQNTFLSMGSPRVITTRDVDGTYSRLPITRTLANSNLALTRTKIDFPWISVVHSL